MVRDKEFKLLGDTIYGETLGQEDDEQAGSDGNLKINDGTTYTLRSIDDMDDELVQAVREMDGVTLADVTDLSAPVADSISGMDAADMLENEQFGFDDIEIDKIEPGQEIEDTDLFHYPEDKDPGGAAMGVPSGSSVKGDLATQVERGVDAVDSIEERRRKAQRKMEALRSGAFPDSMEINRVERYDDDETEESQYLASSVEELPEEDLEHSVSPLIPALDAVASTSGDQFELVEDEGVFDDYEQGELRYRGESGDLVITEAGPLTPGEGINIRYEPDDDAVPESDHAHNMILAGMHVASEHKAERDIYYDIQRGTGMIYGDVGISVPDVDPSDEGLMNQDEEADSEVPYSLNSGNEALDEIIGAVTAIDASAKTTDDYTETNHHA